MVTKFSSNGDLYEHVASKERLDEAIALDYFQQILKAIHHLHTNDIAHRDIKLQNVVISDENVLKLIDFGFAQRIDSDDDLNSTKTTIIKDRWDIKGTRGYISPEMLVAQTKISKLGDFNQESFGIEDDENTKSNDLEVSVDLKASDIFSLGVLLFEMVVGQPPFLNAAPEDSCYRMFYIQKRVPRFWKIHRKTRELDSQNLLSNEFKDLIEQLLTPFPNKRPTIDEVMTHPWCAGLEQSDN